MRRKRAGEDPAGADQAGKEQEQGTNAGLTRLAPTQGKRVAAQSSV
ncbi:MAG: hypothetical protein HIU81_09145 [Acidobacteria bacterium]|nr:hypothetical protein [Acidobacteriota bacterium]